MLCTQGVECLICMAPGQDMGPVPYIWSMKNVEGF
jgi:hypothetical protein